MSAKIYSLPEHLEALVPNIFKVRGKDYQKLEEEFIETVAKFCQDYNPKQSKDYIGKVIRFQIADGYAEYMVLGLSPVKLIHLPLMDAYQAPDVDLMTTQRVKEKIQAQEKLKSLFS